MADIFGSIGGPRWEDAGEAQARNAAIGHQSAQGFISAFNSAYDMANERKYQEQQVDRIKAELAPLQDTFKDVKDYGDFMTRVGQNPQFMLNPRTQPFILKMGETWKAADELKTRAANSKRASEGRQIQNDFSASVSQASDEVKAAIYANPNDVYVYDDEGMIVGISPRARSLYDSWAIQNNRQPFSRFSLQSDFKAEEAKKAQAAKSADLAAKNAEHSKTWQARLDSMMERERFKAQSTASLHAADNTARATRQQVDIDADIAAREDKQKFEAEMAEVNAANRLDYLNQQYDRLSELNKERYALIKQGKQPTGLDLRIKTAAAAYQDAIKLANQRPGNEALKKNAFMREMEMLSLMYLQEKNPSGAKSAAAPSAAPAAGSRKADFRWDPSTRKMVPIE